MLSCFVFIITTDGHIITVRTLSFHHQNISKSIIQSGNSENGIEKVNINYLSIILWFISIIIGITLSNSCSYLLAIVKYGEKINTHGAGLKIFVVDFYNIDIIERYVLCYYLFFLLRWWTGKRIIFIFKISYFFPNK